MKTLLFSLASLALGFTAARLLPVSSPSAAAAGVIKKPAPPSSQPARSLDLKGDWKPAAQAWAAEDPAGFCAWLVQRGIIPERDLLNLLFTAWAAQDTDAAFTAFFNLPADFRRNPRHQMVLSNMMSSVLSVPDGLGTVLKWLPQVDRHIRTALPPDAQWTKSLPPAQTAALLGEHCTGGTYSSSLIRQFAGAWAQQDRAAVMAWMKSLRPELHHDAFTGIIDEWAEQDAPGALAYLATQADSGERMSAYAPLAELAKKDPKAALAWWEENLAMPNSLCVGEIFRVWCGTNAMEARDYAFAIEDPTLRHHALTSWSQHASTGELLETIIKNPDGSNRRYPSSVAPLETPCYPEP